MVAIRIGPACLSEASIVNEPRIPTLCERSSRGSFIKALLIGSKRPITSEKG